MSNAPAYRPALVLLALSSMLLVSGCGSRSEVVESLDPASAQILAGVPPGMNVVLACKMKELPPTLDLPEGGREIARSGNTVLFEVPNADVQGLKGFGDAVSLSVWGGVDHLRKMDHQLQTLLLENEDSGGEGEFSVMARFAPGTGNIGELLESVGVQSRTTAGIVVTITADEQGILRLIQLTQLEVLKNPRQLAPTN